jgi:WD40 repeat protein
MIVLEHKGKREAIRFVRFSPDGSSLIAAPVEGALRLWRNLSAPHPAEILSDLMRIFSAEFTPDARRLLLMNDASQLTIRDLADGTSRHVELWFDQGGENEGALLSPDGTHLIAAQSHHHQYRGWITCRPLDNPTPEAALWTLELPRRVVLSSFLLGGSRLLTSESGHEDSDYSDHCVIRDPFTGKAISTIDTPLFSETHYLRGSDRVLWANFKGRWLWVDSPSGQLAKLRNDGLKSFTSLAFHPSGRYLAATSNDATVKLYDTETWQVAKTYTWDIGKMRSIAFSPDGTLAAAGSDTGKVVVWDVDV